MKKKLLIVIILLLIICLFSGYLYYRYDNAPDNDCVLNVDNVSYEYYEEVSFKDIVDSNCKLINNDYIDTYSLGKKNVNIYYMNNRNKKRYITFNYEVVDTTKPILLLSSSYTSYLGEEVDFLTKGICADNYDKRPNCYVEGEYDINKEGTYDLVYHAVDTSNNSTEKSFKLKIVKKSNSNSSTSSNKKSLNISDVISKYKNDNTMIGIDVSAWQDKIDYNKVKEAGVEFVIIRIGFGHKNNEIVLDNWFNENIKNAKEVGLKVGLYFYSYATSIKESKEQANWIIKTLNNEKLDLPIAFDFESWSKFNSYNMSLTDINQNAKVFIDTLNDNGYDGMLYSSKYYLENIWNLDKYTTWLAHYTSETNYEGNYYIWQMSNRGSVPGINGDVDIDILYNDNFKNTK